MSVAVDMCMGRIYLGVMCFRGRGVDVFGGGPVGGEAKSALP